MKIEIPEINMQKGSQTKVESDSDSDPDYLDYLKQTQAKKKRRRMPRSQKILMGLKAQQVKIIFQPQKMKLTTLKSHTKEIMEKILKKVLETILRKILMRSLEKTTMRTLRRI